MKNKFKVWSKKWWFWVIVAFLVIGIIGSFGGNWFGTSCIDYLYGQ